MYIRRKLVTFPPDLSYNIIINSYITSYSLQSLLLVPLVFITMSLYRFIIWRYIVMWQILFCWAFIGNGKNLETKIIKN